MNDSVRLLERTLDQLVGVLDGVDPAQSSLPTPCESWDVKELAAHVVLGLDNSLEQARGGRPDWTAPAPDPGTDWAGTARARSTTLVEAWRATDLSGTLDLPGMGTAPATFPVDQQIAEFAVHTWDLVSATGQRPAFDPEVGEHALAWARQVMRPEFRGPDTGFGEEVPAPADASAHVRLAAFFGRHPTM